MADAASTTVTDVAYKGGPLGGQHNRLVGEVPAEDERHGGTYRLEGTSYVWAPDPDRALPHAADGDEASAALDAGAEVLVDKTPGVRTDGPSTSPAVAVKSAARPAKAATK